MNHVCDKSDQILDRYYAAQSADKVAVGVLPDDTLPQDLQGRADWL